jgi:uncharacterized protein (TIGR03083 family)
MTEEMALAYAGTRERLTALLDDRAANQAANPAANQAGDPAPRQHRTPVPGCPGWDVHSVVSHLAGITSDVLAGQFEGAPGDAWTAAQVQQRAQVPTTEVLAEWGELGPALEARFGDLGPLAYNFTYDAHVHEDDVREALGLTLGVAPTAAMVLAGLTTQVAGRAVHKAGLASMRLETAEGDLLQAGIRDEVGLTLRCSRGEALRMLAGRRTMSQVRTWDFSTDPGPWLPHLTLFGWMPEA